MEKHQIASLEALLKLDTLSDTGALVSDCSVLTCGCLVSESSYLSATDLLKNFRAICPNCNRENVAILASIEPLRSLYQLLQKWNSKNFRRDRRRSSSKRSVHSNINEHVDNSKDEDSMDLMRLVFEYSKEEVARVDFEKTKKSVGFDAGDDGKIAYTGPEEHSVAATGDIEGFSGMGEVSGSEEQQRQLQSQQQQQNPGLLELNEVEEFNLSKCFPFYRKHSVFPTQQLKINLPSITSNPFKLNVIKRGNSFNSNDMCTFVDHKSGSEVTRFVLLSKKRWELYEIVTKLDSGRAPPIKPVLLCCGRLNGSYGPDWDNLKDNNHADLLVKNEFSDQNKTDDASTTSTKMERRLEVWVQLFCKLSRNYLVISGTKGIMRVLNINTLSSRQELGKPIYTYLTDFPIRCVSISPDESSIACGITAKERLSHKEQPFIVLHKIKSPPKGNDKHLAVNTITITIPHRDPIKLINFNSDSSHLVCGTVWESTLLVIRLRDEGSDDCRRPRLIWSESHSSKHRRGPNSLDSEVSSFSKSDADHESMLDEGITDVKFSSYYPNVIITTFASFTNMWSLMVRFDGTSLVHTTKSGISNPPESTLFESEPLQSKNHLLTEDDDSNIHSIKSSEVILRVPEVGSTIHKTAVLPRGDGIVFLDKSGRIYLVSTPNFQLHPVTKMKKLVVLLGEAANAERSHESASVSFSPDGGKVFCIDRKGVFQVFDFTKGIPGQDSDVVKSKIINV